MEYRKCEGDLALEYKGCCDDFINILLINGYKLNLKLDGNLLCIHYEKMLQEF